MQARPRGSIRLQEPFVVKRCGWMGCFVTGRRSMCAWRCLDRRLQRRRMIQNVRVDKIIAKKITYGSHSVQSKLHKKCSMGPNLQMKVRRHHEKTMCPRRLHLASPRTVGGTRCSCRHGASLCQPLTLSWRWLNFPLLLLFTSLTLSWCVFPGFFLMRSTNDEDADSDVTDDGGRIADDDADV